MRRLFGNRWAALLIASAIGCAAAAGTLFANRSIDVEQLGPICSVDLYNNGRPNVGRPAIVGSAEDHAVHDWLRKHQDGWRPSLVTYAPFKVVRGENFALNFHDDLAILNIWEGDGNSRQLTRPIAEDDAIDQIF